MYKCGSSTLSGNAGYYLIFLHYIYVIAVSLSTKKTMSNRTICIKSFIRSLKCTWYVGHEERLSAVEIIHRILMHLCVPDVREPSPWAMQFSFMIVDIAVIFVVRVVCDNIRRSFLILHQASGYFKIGADSVFQQVFQGIVVQHIACMNISYILSVQFIKSLLRALTSTRTPLRPRS